MKIKFHDNTCGIQYGPDHQLTDNWDPTKDYGNEYVQVHFRIDAKGYGYPEFSFKESQRNAFDSEIKEIFSTTGWNRRDVTRPDEKSFWMCTFLKRGLESLYAHPQDISGLVLKKNVGELAELFSKAKTFKLRWVDLYKTYYDLTDADISAYYESNYEDVRQCILQYAKTKRKDRFVSIRDLETAVTDKYGILLAKEYDNPNHRYVINAAAEYTRKIICKCIEEGTLVRMPNGSDSSAVRTINKTEQKKKKLLLAV